MPALGCLLLRLLSRSRRHAAASSRCTLCSSSPLAIEASDPATEADVRRHLSLLPDFVTPAEESAMMSELQPALRRLRYESAHWDDAIHNYREMERRSWSQENSAVLHRLAVSAGLTGDTKLEHVHVLDLAETGHIRPHVDAVRFCGSVIAGLSLLSDCVMRFYLAEGEDGGKLEQRQLASSPRWAKVLLPRRSLYVMRDRLRFCYAHAVLGNEDPDNCIGRGGRVQKGRRVSVICRCLPEPQVEADSKIGDPSSDMRERRDPS